MEIQEQLMIEDKDVKSCAFSGHRLLGEDFDKAELEKTVRARIAEGVREFYCGMAYGFDLCAAECVIDLKKEYKDIRLTACIPCQGQERKYSEENKARYVRALKNCDEQILLSDHYYSGCMLKRDEYMAKTADVLIAYCRKSTGGTAYTVKCFEKNHKKVYFL